MTHFFYFCHSQIILINNMAFSLDCGTYYIVIGNGQWRISHSFFHKSHHVVVLAYQRVSTLTLIFNFKAIGFRWPLKYHDKVMKVSWKFISLSLSLSLAFWYNKENYWVDCARPHNGVGPHVGEKDWKFLYICLIIKNG